MIIMLKLQLKQLKLFMTNYVFWKNAFCQALYALFASVIYKIHKILGHIFCSGNNI